MNMISTGTHSPASRTTYGPMRIGPDGRSVNPTPEMKDMYAKLDAKRAKQAAVKEKMMSFFGCFLPARNRQG